MLETMRSRALCVCSLLLVDFFFFLHFSHQALIYGSLCPRYQTHPGCVLLGYTRPTDRPGISGSSLESQLSFSVLLTGLFSLCSFLSAHSWPSTVLLPLGVQPHPHPPASLDFQFQGLLTQGVAPWTRAFSPCRWPARVWHFLYLILWREILYLFLSLNLE